LWHPRCRLGVRTGRRISPRCVPGARVVVRGVQSVHNSSQAVPGAPGGCPGGGQGRVPGRPVGEAVGIALPTPSESRQMAQLGCLFESHPRGQGFESLSAHFDSSPFMLRMKGLVAQCKHSNRWKSSKWEARSRMVSDAGASAASGPAESNHELLHRPALHPQRGQGRSGMNRSLALRLLACPADPEERKPYRQYR